MRCGHCGSWNAEDEHRCGMCGRRLKREGAPPAAAARPLPEGKSAPPPPDKKRSRSGAPRQGSLFERKIIPFDSIAPPRVAGRGAGSEPATSPAGDAAGSNPVARLPRRTAPNDLPALRRRLAGQPAAQPVPAPPPSAIRMNQPNLNLVAPAPKTRPAVCCRAPVASIRLRSAAAVVDALLVLMGLGFFAVPLYVMGGRIVLSQKAAPGYILAVVTMALFYHLVWRLAKRDTPGMRYFGLRLLNFDGYPPDSQERTIRLLAACLSILALGLGLLWALVDQEKLTWHDHISKTFLTDQKRDSRK
jgi:uncharacterized RDD family membrane protein YckC